VYSDASQVTEALRPTTLTKQLNSPLAENSGYYPLVGARRWLVVLVWLAGLVTGSIQGAEPGWHQLSGHVPDVVAQLTPLASLPGSNQLSLAIGLPLRDPAGLTALVNQIYDPHSTNYHHFLSTSELTDRFGPTKAAYQAVVNFVSAQGLRVTGQSDNRMVLDVQASVTTIQQAFHTTLRTYQHPTENRRFFAPDMEPSVPVNVPVSDMWGLSDYGRPRPLVHLATRPAATALNGSGSGANYQGRDFRTAYVPGTSLVGSGQIAAVAEFDSFYPGAITSYESMIGYTNVPLQTVLLDGVSGLPGYSGVNNADVEVALDIEMIVAMAPGLSQLIVYEGNSPYDVFNRIYTDGAAQQISCSWAFSAAINNTSWPGGTNFGTLDSQLQLMAAHGQSFFQSSGDSDAYTGKGALSTHHGPVPVDSPYVTSVGGTSLTMNGTAASWASETVWNSGGDVGSSGGVSPNYLIPAWQQGISMAMNKGSTVYRNIPDVALTGANVLVYYATNTVGTVDGTSCAAPLWAGLCALINQQSQTVGGASVGLLNSALYAIGTGASYTNCFHDIITGNNIGTNTAGEYYATNGYDLCTGLGTPNGTNLINALAPPLLPYFYLQPASQNLTNGANLTLGAAAGGVTPYEFAWLCNGTNLAAGGNVSGTSSNVLTITAITTNNAGSYSLVVANPNGSATSVTAVVNVGFAPALTTQPAPLTVFAGSNAVFSVTTTGSTPLAWQWRKNGTNLANGSVYSGANTSQLTVLAATTNSGGNFSVVVTNLFGSITSSAAALNVVQPPLFTVPLAVQTIQCSSNATLNVTVIGTPPPAFQWSLDGAAITGATNTSLTLTNVRLPSHLLSVAVTNLYGSVTSTATLTVQDTQPPVVALLGTNRLYVELGSTFSDPGATAYDACYGAETVTVLGSVNTNVVGTNVLTYQATDGNGNTGTATRYVIVRDTTPPTILWSFTNLVLAAGANCEAPMPDVTGTNFIRATDLSGTTIITESPAANTGLELGTNQVILTASDPSGNQAFSTNTIVVQDQTPPVVTAQPQSQTNNTGTTASFGLTATACTPLTYQWFFNSARLAGQTNAALTLPVVTLASAGNYAAVATAAGGSTTSSVAILSVPTPPVIVWSFTNLVLAAATNCAASMPDVTGTNYILATVWSGLPLITQSPATNTELSIGTNVVLLTVSDIYGNATDATNTIVVQDETAPELTGEPQSETNTVGSTASFSATATACTPLSYQWLFDNAILTGQTNATLTLAGVNLPAAGGYSVQVTSAGGSVTSSVAVLTVAALPVVQWSFTNLVLLAATNCAAPMPDVTGTNYIVASVWSGQPVIVQIPDTNSDLPVGTNPVVLAVSDNLGNTVYSTNLIAVQDQTPPVVTAQPQSQTNNTGTTASFTLTATACTPLTYQWLFNNTLLAGQTNTTLNLPGVTLASAGNYAAVATAAGGSTTSSVAILSVPTPPVIVWSFTNLVLAATTNCAASMPDVTGTNYILATVWSGLPLITQSPATNTELPIGTNVVLLTVTDIFGNATDATNTIVVLDETAPELAGEPQSETNTVGATASFAITATACTPLSYQWMFDNAILAGQTNATLALAGVDLSAAGNYSVQVTSAGGSVTSSVVVLTVASLPVVQWSFTNLVLQAVTNCAAPMPDVTGTNYFMASVWSGQPVIVQNPDTNSDLPVGTNPVVLAVSDDLGNTVYSTNLIVVQDVTAPQLASQPQSETNTVGSTASFAVSASACTPLSYQWLFDNVVLTGQTNATLTLPGLVATNAGNYSVVVTSAGGFTTSTAAALVVNVPVVLTVSGNPGTGFDFTVTGPAGGTCIVEMTTNLLSTDGWQAFFTNDFDLTGTAQFVDDSATNDAQRFYRARVGP